MYRPSSRRRLPDTEGPCTTNVFRPGVSEHFAIVASGHLGLAFISKPSRRGMTGERFAMSMPALRLLKGKTQVAAGDYREVLGDAGLKDIVYMDPPYQGVCGERDGRYIKGLSFEGLHTRTEKAERAASFLHSQLRRQGERQGLRQTNAEDLDLFRMELDAGRSTQATLLGKDMTTYEFLISLPRWLKRTR